jgi:squalene-associated FAD-dependent desaturase
MPREDLLVIGGGWAGVAAAWNAARRGLRVLLLEGGTGLGGRAGSFVDPVSGERLDNGQHLFLGAYRESLALLEDLATAPWVEFQSPLRIPYLLAGGRIETLSTPRLPGPLGLLWGLARFQPFSGADRAALLKLGLLGMPSLAPAFWGFTVPGSAQRNVAEWLRSCGQTPALIRLVWEPMILAACNARPEQARLREFLAVLGQGFLRGGRSSALGRPMAPLARLLHPFPRWLEARKGRIRFGAVVRRLRRAEGEWSATLSDGECVRAPRVIAALPARRLFRLMEPADALALGLEAEALRPLSPIVSVLLWSERPLLPASLQAFGPEADGRQARFHWGFQDRTEGAWRACLVASAADALAAEPPAAVLGSLPAFLASRGLPAHFIRARVLQERAATPRFEAGSPARLSQATLLPGLALAGDWTETGLPATIEGAVRSGRLAFEALAQG